MTFHNVIVYSRGICRLVSPIRKNIVAWLWRSCWKARISGINFASNENTETHYILSDFEHRATIRIFFYKVKSWWILIKHNINFKIRISSKTNFYCAIIIKMQSEKEKYVSHTFFCAILPPHYFHAYLSNIFFNFDNTYTHTS